MRQNEQEDSARQILAGSLPVGVQSRFLLPPPPPPKAHTAAGSRHSCGNRSPQKRHVDSPGGCVDVEGWICGVRAAVCDLLG